MKEGFESNIKCFLNEQNNVEQCKVVLAIQNEEN